MSTDLLESCKKMENFKIQVMIYLFTLISCVLLYLSIINFMNPPKVDKDGKEDPKGEPSYSLPTIYLVVSILFIGIIWYINNMKDNDAYLTQQCAITVGDTTGNVLGSVFNAL